MRSWLLVGCVLLGSLFSVGCDSGGSTDSGGSAVNTPLTVVGSADVPVSAVDAWAASIRPAFDFTKLTAHAYGYTGVQLGEAALNADKTFVLTLSAADSEVTIKITSSKGFEVSKWIGAIGATGMNVGIIDATTTCQLLLQKEYGLSTDTTSVAFTSLLTALMNSLTVSPNLANGTIVDAIKISQSSTMLAFKNSQDTIKSRFTLIDSAMRARSLANMVQYFSAGFTSSDPTLAATVTLDNFKITTQDRFNTFSIESYIYNVEKVVFTDSTTAVAYGNTNIAVTRISDHLQQYAPLFYQRVTWRVENGNWVVYKDFPYLKTQLGF